MLICNLPQLNEYPEEKSREYHARIFVKSSGIR
jgi:hypothetical protein